MTIETVEGLSFPKRETTLLSFVSAAHFISHVHIMVVPALIPLLPGYFGVSFLQIGVALTVFNLVSLVVQTPMGFITDRVGAWTMLILALTLGGASFGSLALIPSYGWLLAAMVLAGVANGIYHPADYALLSASIGERRLGKAFSIHTFAGFFGTAVTPAVLLAVANQMSTGSACALAGIASVTVALVILGAAPRRAEPGKSGVVAKPTSHRLKDVATPQVMLLTLLFVLLSLSSIGISAFAVTALIKGYGADLPSASSALTAFLFAGACGVLAGGFLADRLHHHGVVASIAMVIAAMLTLAIAITHLSGLPLIFAMAGAGFLAGVITPSRDLLVRAASPRGAEGRVFGIVSTGFNIGGAIGPILFAWLVDHGYYQAVFGVTALFMVLTAALTFLPVFEKRQAA
ncbi:MFS transporter [Bradyrhizobium prioriisuperbiae]|uniref:MFS transporter n=1 Tax=Bradyrhizobium prioriisuperbiae TaxID=2854389 RepID=UPI0028EB81BE|nr:MFS transporter [Bradyrhizobium prioritasuperba]